MSGSGVVFVAGATFNVLAVANLMAVFLFVIMLVGMYAVLFHLKIQNFDLLCACIGLCIVYESDYSADQLFFSEYGYQLVRIALS